MAQMVPVRAYHAPSSLDECLEILEKERDQVVVLAGGQSLLPLLKTRGLRPEVLLDLAKVQQPQLQRLAVDESGSLEVGAMCRYRDLWRSSQVQNGWSALADAAAGIGDRQIQNRGTLGGNLAFGTVLTDMKQVVMCLSAELRIVGPQGARTESALELFADPTHMLLEPGELLESIRFPALAAGSGSAYQKYGITTNGRPVVGVAAALTLDSAGLCSSARIVIGGLVPCPCVAKRAAETLIGQRLDEDVIGAAADAASQEIKPQSDSRASAAHRRQLVRTHSRQILQLALKRARGALER